ncbi:hypothetical protein C8F04DRAFT_1275660 [Mycena alexandri]|uniref:Uncharacterized protein n=1 Tax=Mycena alexandri TaxID=1745969 RepID=A0AAD6S2C6_9AGAR|nr:hypothetical protein C8F04DRAFT_1275660 [Mycena alexandri]
MEQKHNVEGSDVQELVFLLQDNDNVHARLAELEALNRELQKKINITLRTRPNVHLPPPRTARTTWPMPSPGRGRRTPSSGGVWRRAVRRASSAAVDDTPAMITRPHGSAGNDFNIEEEMGLGGSAADQEQYKAIQMRPRVSAARIDWETPWGQIPAAAKAQLFAVARERHPYLARFTNDWATEEIVKQYTKNKRRNAYANRWLDAPSKFAYLKANSAKRNPDAPRKKSKKFDRASLKKAAKRAKKVDAAKVPPGSGTGKAKAGGSGKGKRRQVAVEEDDEDMYSSA